ncbi:MAG: UvrD-helicase domain-containing protein, partial [Hyphomicrobiales bacterium]|nr:UvrD-helicase domain-containing protein [Hyphomicrobiales bacterium]
DELANWIALNDEKLLRRIHEHTGHVDMERDRLGAARQLFARALETPGGLKVQTIHAFCERLLQRFPVEAGMVPGFEVMDDQTARDVLGDARAQVLAEARTKPDGDTAQHLATIVGFTSADRFDDLLKGLLSHRHTLRPLFTTASSLQAGLRQLSDLLDVDPDLDADSIIESAIDAMDIAAYQHALSSKYLAKPARGGIEAALRAQGPHETFARLQHAYLTAKGEFRAERGLFAKSAAIDAPDLAEFVLSEQQRIAHVTERLRAAQVYAATSALMQVGRQIVAAYETEKRRRGLCDYDDLISRTRELLEEKEASLWVLFKLDGGLDHVLIDEAQDTSPQQWSIIARLTEEFFAGEGAHTEAARTIFAVGDYKQSIFSFQGADPAEFARMQTLFRNQITGVGESLAEVPLNASFRSTPEVLKVVDDVFAQPLAGIGLEEVTDGAQTHHAKRIGQEGLVELWPLEVREDKADLSIWTAPKRIDAGSHPRLRLARKIAATIRRWIEDKDELTPRGRAIRYSDILLLVRQRTTFMDALVRALKLDGIPVAGADRLELTKHIAVQDLMALARFVLLPEDDLTLASVLKGPLVARDDGQPIEDHDLFRLAHDRGKQTLWERLSTAVDDDEPYEHALSALQAWRSRAGFATPYGFFSQVLIADSGRKALLRRLGTEASDPIDAFLAEALNFQAGHTPSLHDFLGWLEGASLQIKRDMDHSANEVRIMTVHGAKGLEANIVILPDTTDVPDAGKTPDVLFWQGETSGPLPIWKLRAQDKISITSALKDQHSRRAMEEYNRLLYVAMTRA